MRRHEYEWVCRGGSMRRHEYEWMYRGGGV
jgi:hypothetical protein